MFVHLSSQRTLVPVRQDGCFAEKEEPHPGLLLIVRRSNERAVRGRTRNRADAKASASPEVSRCLSSGPAWAACVYGAAVDMASELCRAIRAANSVTTSRYSSGWVTCGR